MTPNEKRPGYKVEIYNRYQQKVFEGDNGWDGTYRGKLADPGTYYFRLFMKDGRVLKGPIEVAKF
jgi:gliding motility-associated-like protein